MAILFGTTSDGNTLPVQVNALGQLVAQGVEGPAGPPGPEGPIGPVGEVEFSSGTFAPTFGSDTGDGEALLEYQAQEGYWYRFGPLLTIQVLIRTSSAIVINARGKLTVKDIPDEARFALPVEASGHGFPGVSSFGLMGTGRAINCRVIYRYNNHNFRFRYNNGDAWNDAMFASLDGELAEDNMIIFSFSGIARGEVRSLEIPDDYLT